jgi:transposase-like protein
VALYSAKHDRSSIKFNLINPETGSRIRMLTVDGETEKEVERRAKWPKLAGFIDNSETDVLTHLDFPVQHRTKIHSTNPLERLNKEVKRRADVVGIFPNEASIIRLVGAVLLEQNDEWAMQHRYMQVEGMAELTAGSNENTTLALTT